MQLERLLRFLPVKQTSDLLLVMSNLYSLDHGALIMSPMVGDLYLICCIQSTVPESEFSINNVSKQREPIFDNIVFSHNNLTTLFLFIIILFQFQCFVTRSSF